jgi:hypothetical protein
VTDVLQERLEPYREARRIPCACAVGAATACGVPPAAMGEAANGLGIRISECQLGLFGYELYGEKRWTRRLGAVPPALEQSVRAACAENRLACAAAWRLADERGLPRLLFGSVAETLDVRVSRCQLGCFD